MIMPNGDSYIVDPSAWLKRHDRDPELHATVERLVDQDREEEAVLFLAQYVASTAEVRAKVGGWGRAWTKAVRDLSALRTKRAVRTLTGILETHESGEPE